MKYVSKFSLLSFFVVAGLFCSIDQDIVETCELIERVEKHLSDNNVSGVYWKIINVKLSDFGKRSPVLLVSFDRDNKQECLLKKFKNDSNFLGCEKLPENYFSNKYNAEALAKELSLSQNKYLIMNEGSLLIIHLSDLLKECGWYSLDPMFYHEEVKNEYDKDNNVFVNKFNKHFSELSKKQSVRICNIIDFLYKEITASKAMLARANNNYYLHFLASLIVFDLKNLKQHTKSGLDIDFDCIINTIIKLMFFDDNEAQSNLEILQYSVHVYYFNVYISAVSELFDLLKYFMTDSKYSDRVSSYYFNIKELCEKILRGDCILYPMNCTKILSEECLDMITKSE